jgi:hypothetical protein
MPRKRSSISSGSVSLTVLSSPVGMPGIRTAGS